MKPPEQDIEDRAPLWDALQMLFMDTDVTLSYEHIVRTCKSSKYSIDEVEDILFNEVMPAVRFNLLMLPAPEWCGFDVEWLKDRVLKKHRFGRRRPLWFRRYTDGHWKALRRLIHGT
ncbi:MAG: hypothetical protein AAGE85_12070 [Pseudomonadota bacterium]